MFITVIFLHCQLYKFLKVIFILLHKILMLLHSLLKDDKELFNKVVVRYYSHCFNRLIEHVDSVNYVLKAYSSV